MRQLFLTLVVVVLASYGVQQRFAVGEQPAAPALEQSINDVFFDIQVGVDREIQAAFVYLDTHWQDAFLPFALDTLYLLKEPQVSRQLIAILEDKTKQQFGRDTFAWWQWLWSQPENLHPEYGQFKSRLYGLIHFPFKHYFTGSQKNAIRLDEVLWGGVKQDGIPPLRNPKMITAREAAYLQDDNLVFGIAIGDDVRAYPKRILAWHEMFVDEVGGKAVAGVY